MAVVSVIPVTSFAVGNFDTPLNRHNLTQRSFGQLLAKAGLPQTRFHDLGYTAATILLWKGVHAKYVQELLGQATIAITLDSYSHVLPQMGGETAEAMRRSVGQVAPEDDAEHGPPSGNRGHRGVAS